MTSTWKERGILAVVPARGGSKRIPRKNLQSVAGLSLVGWAAQTCRQLPWLTGALLSTDDEEVAEEGRCHGLAVPFMRPPELATDSAGSREMWQHAWRRGEEHFGRTFECSILLQPTTPLRRARDVERCVAEVMDEGHGGAVTVGRIPGHFVPEKLLRLDQRGCVTLYLDRAGSEPEQTVPEYYWRNGACYAVSRQTLMEEGCIVERDCKAVIVEDLTVSIDDPYELQHCELLARERRDAHPGRDPDRGPDTHQS